jgi:hypothetical protein
MGSDNQLISKQIRSYLSLWVSLWIDGIGSQIGKPEKFFCAVVVTQSLCEIGLLDLFYFSGCAYNGVWQQCHYERM